MKIADGDKIINSREILAKTGIKQGMRIADFGCGNLGYFVIPAAKVVGKEGRAYAVDIQKPVLEGVVSRAKLEGLTNLETVWSNLEMVGATAIEPNSLDAVFLVNILFQNKDKHSILAEAVRLVKNGGKIAIVDWNKFMTLMGPEPALRVEPQTVKDLAGSLNLQLVEETKFGEYFWGLIFIKI